MGVERMHLSDYDAVYIHPAIEDPIIWDFPTYQQLALCLDWIGASLDDLPDWKSGQIDLVPFPQLIDKSPEILHERSTLLLRFSSLMMSVLPLLDLFSKEVSSVELGAIRKMRGLILGRDKSELISKLLHQCRRGITGERHPRGGRGAWCDVTVDRMGAHPGNSL